MRFDARTRLVTLPSSKTHAGTPIRLCVDNLDLRFRISTGVTETKLPRVEDGYTELLKGADMALAPRASPPDRKATADNLVLASSDAIDRIRKAYARLAAAAPVSVDDAKGLGLEVARAHAALSTFDRSLTAARTASASVDVALTAAGLSAAQTAALNAEKALLDQAISAATLQQSVIELWSQAAAAFLAHLELASLSAFDVAINADTRAEITIKGTRIALSTKDVNGALTPATASTTEDLAKGTVEVRSLSYGRVSPGLILSEVVERKFKIAPNEIGAPVITGTQDGALVPTLFLGHYWCPADVRELQPYDRSRGCWWANAFVPSVAVGIPLSRNPLHHLFIGGLLQPVPGISVVFGRHYGYIARLRPEFVEGSAPPAPVTTFRIDDAVAHRWTYGSFLGVTLSDALFMTLLQRLVK